MAKVIDSSDAQLDIPTAIEAERLALCDFLDQPDEAGWEAQSWCDAWTVREVVAHLTTSTRTGIWDMVKGAWAARGDFDRSRWYGAPKRFVGLYLTANDANWSHGNGTEHIDGAAIDLLPIATGRPQALPELTGNGVAQLTRRMVG